jgi:hypothetical protein
MIIPNETLCIGLVAVLTVTAQTVALVYETKQTTNSSYAFLNVVAVILSVQCFFAIVLVQQTKDDMGFSVGVVELCATAFQLCIIIKSKLQAI